MSIPRAVWTCPVCGLETDFPKERHPCYLKNCPHQGRQGTGMGGMGTPRQREQEN